MSLETVPKDLRNLRACFLCSLVKTIEQFEFDGCDNCDEYLHMKNNRDMVYECTSSSFDGKCQYIRGAGLAAFSLKYFLKQKVSVHQRRLVALMGPEDSWVGKWLRINRFVKGCYAISVTGRLPHGVISELKSKGINYRSRDIAQKT